MNGLAIRVGLVVSFFAGGCYPAPASAAGPQLTICNHTSSTLSDVAVGYHSSGVNDAPGSNILTGPFVSTGWTRILAGQCAGFANPFNARYLFWWGAQGGGINTGGNVWAVTGDASFCIPDVYGPVADMASTFAFEDENVSQAVCESHSANPRVGPNRWVSVRKVDVDVNTTVTFEGT